MGRRTETGEPGPGISLVQPVKSTGRATGGCAGTEGVTGGHDECLNALLRQGSLPWKRRIGPHADVSVDGARGALRHLDIGVTACVVGPLRWCESEHAAKNDQRDRCLEDGRLDLVRSDLPETAGGSLQRFVTLLEPGELDESPALRHDQELRFETPEHRVNIGVELGANFIEPDFKRKRHQLPRLHGQSIGSRTAEGPSAARLAAHGVQAHRVPREQSSGRG